MSSRKPRHVRKLSEVALGGCLLASLALVGCGVGSSSKSLPGSNATLSSLAVSPVNPTVGVGGIQNFVATGTYSDGSTANLTSSAAWSSSANAVLTIQSTGQSNPGVATGVTAGSATVTASVGSVSGATQVTVKVNLPPLTSISVTPATGSVAEGSTFQFTATGTATDGSKSNQTAFATWTSSNNTFATVQTTAQAEPGEATGVAAGTVTITASENGVSGTATLTVTPPPPPLLSIQVTPLLEYTGVNSTVQFSATGTYGDGSTQNVSASATWTSSDTSVATVESTGEVKAGQATGVSLGTSTITASLNGFSSSAALTVTGSGVFEATPLTDLVPANGACGTYESFPGGLYENCANTLPADHAADGLTIAGQVVPLDVNGIPNPSGQIVFAAIGMSAALAEFAPFIADAAASTSVNNTTMSLFNGAASLQDACDWFPAVGPPGCDSTDPNNYDRITTQMSGSGRGLTPQEIEVAWIDEENGRVHSAERGCQPLGTECLPLCDPTISGCTNTADTTDALNLEQELGNILRAAKVAWPNLKMAFFNSRIFGGYALSTANSASPEPFAYESGFAVKWLVEAQINQIRTGTVDPVAGDLSYGVAPWIAWGAYTWASGPIPRSDGLVWCNGQPDAPCSGEMDFDPDGVHPNPMGAGKVATMMMNYFLTSPQTIPWFVAP